MQVLKPEWVWTPDGVRTRWCVEIDAGRIVGVNPGERHPDGVVALPGKLLVPGLVNAHSHAFQRAFRGHVQWRAAGRDDFWSWRDRMYAVANAVSPDDVQAVSALAFLEMVEAGITRVGEFHYLHHQPDGTPYADPDELAKRVIAAAGEVGLRICLLRVAYARNGPGEAIRSDQRRFADADPDAVLAAVERLAAVADPAVTVGLAPHSVRAVPLDYLRALSSFGGVVHSHLSEQPAEVEGCLAEHGMTPLAVMAEAGLVSERFAAVHLTHPAQDDEALLRRLGASVCVCPTTELDLGDGFLPLSLRDGVPLCVGSDSHATIDILAEARALEMHARALATRRNVMAPEGERHGLAERLLAIATTDGDRALGGEGHGIELGAPADLVAIDLDRPAALGVPPLEAAVFNATPEWVTDVWVGGHHLVEDGSHPQRDEILRRVGPTLDRLGS